jgi:hypothetical protein
MMQRSIHVVFDREVLRPEEPIDFKPNGRYDVTIEEVPFTPQGSGEAGILDDLHDLITGFGITDLAAQHDHYLYGLPKR